MSRRHKENDVEQAKPQQAESHADGSPRIKRFNISCASLFNKLIKVPQPETSITSKFADMILGAVLKAIRKKDIEIDDEWVKFPRKYLERSILFSGWGNQIIEEAQSPVEKPKRGHPWLSRLINNVEDSKVVDWFKTTLNEAKKTLKETYQNITQFAVCFLNGIHKAFCPDDDPYGKLSHYHRLLVNPEEPEKGIPSIPSRETLSRHYRWFRDWREAVTYEDRKAKKEKRKHRIWEKLIQWIKVFLLKLAPQYAAQPVYGVGI